MSLMEWRQRYCRELSRLLTFEFNSPGFYNFSVRQFMSFFLFLPHLAPLFSFSLQRHPKDRIGCQDIDREQRIRPKNSELHELPYTESLKSGTTRLGSDYSQGKSLLFALRYPQFTIHTVYITTNHLFRGSLLVPGHL